MNRTEAPRKSARRKRTPVSRPRPVTAHRRLLTEVLATDFPYPAERFHGRGIVICGGGLKYLPCAWVCLQMLRHLGCTLPIELWHLGPREMPGEMRALLAPLGVTCIDATRLLPRHPARRLQGWELKCYAILHSHFREVLLLDADNVPVLDPTYLFDTPEYRAKGAIFWPDFEHLQPERPIWKILGLPYRDEPEVESGQLLIDKKPSWRALQLAWHLNDHSDYYYLHIYGDKETFHLGWHLAGTPYAQPARGIYYLTSTMCQHDFQGRRLFQHRNFAKWQLHGENPRIPGFWHEAECLTFLATLRAHWDGLPPGIRRWRPTRRGSLEHEAAAALCAHPWLYRRLGHDERPMTFTPDGRIARGAASCEHFWDLRAHAGRLHLEIFSPTDKTLTATLHPDGTYRGHWLLFEMMAVEFAPLPLPMLQTPLPVSPLSY